jgi:hypothetical protein
MMSFRFQDETKRAADIDARVVLPRDPRDIVDDDDEAKNLGDLTERTASTWACIPFNLPWFGCYKKGFCLQAKCYRISLSPAQWLYFANAVCAGVHFFWYWLLVTSCNSRRLGVVVNPNCTYEQLDIRILRLKSNWTDRGADGWAYEMVDNHRPINFLTAAAWFHALSGAFHSFVLLVAWNPALNFLYLDLINACINPYRWLEYAASAPLMFLCLQLSAGIREEATLALSFALLSTTMIFGLVTELASRPVEFKDDSGYLHLTWQSMPPLTQRLARLLREEKKAKRNKASFEGRQSDLRRRSATVAPLSAVGAAPLSSSTTDEEYLRWYKSHFWAAYRRRILPHVLGYTPYLAVWVHYVYNFFTSLSDAAGDNPDLYARIPSWIPYAVLSTFVFFSSFALAQVVNQYQDPQFYWRGELIYCFLSLFSKLLLGTLLLVNVLSYGSYEEAMAQTPAALTPPPPAPPLPSPMLPPSVPPSAP